MKNPCISANLLYKGEATDLLEGYVLLAFFLSLILTFALVLLFTKYVTLHLKKQKQKDIYIQECKKLPFPRKRPEDDDTESDSDEIVNYSSSTEEISSKKESFRELDEIGSDSTSLHCFETNYISKNSSQVIFDAFTKDEVDELGNTDGYDTLLLDLQNETNHGNEISSSPFSAIFGNFLDIQAANRNYDLPNQICAGLHHFICFRKRALQSFLKFAIDIFYRDRIISDELKIYLESKYDQKIDEFSSENPIKQLLQVSQTVLEISKEFPLDMYKYNEFNPKQSADFSHVMQLFCNLHLDCIKVLSSQVFALCSISDSHEVLSINAIVDVKEVFSLLKFRILFFAKKLSTFSGFNNDHYEKMVAFLDIFSNQLKASLKTEILQLNQIRLEECRKLKERQSLHEISLKQELHGMTDNSIKEKTNTFREYLLDLFISHEKEHHDLLLDLLEYEDKVLRKVMDTHYAVAMKELSNLEEEILSSLYDESLITENDLKAFLQETQQQFQQVKQDHEDVKSNYLSITNTSMAAQSRSVGIFLEFLIKQVSSVYKASTNSLKEAVLYLPSIQKQLCDKILASMQKKLSVVVFDLVLSLAMGFQGISKINFKALDELSLSQLLSDTKAEIKNFEQFSDQQIGEKILENFENIVEIVSFPINDVYSKFYSVLVMVINEKILSAFEEKMDKCIQDSVSAHHENHLQIYERVSSIKNTYPAIDDTQKKYMSRKRSSYKSKSNVEELKEEYESLLALKQTRYNDYCKQIRAKQFSERKKNKSQANSLLDSCKIALDMQNVYAERGNTEYLRELFDFEHQYMIERLLKKILLNDDFNKTKRDVTDEESTPTVEKSLNTDKEPNEFKEQHPNEFEERRPKKKSKLKSVLAGKPTDSKFKANTLRKNTVSPLPNEKRASAMSKKSKRQGTISPIN